MSNYDVEVSIIVPVYNTEKFLRTCLDSLLCQTLESFEIICVNNGSTDSSGEILREYEKNNPQLVRVFDIEHSNYVGTGRNYGISKARGKYIYLCDSDDIIEKNGVFFLYNRMKHYKLDTVYGAVNFVNLQSNTSFMLESDGERDVTISELIQSGAEFWRRMFTKELLDKVGPMPENTKFDDIAYLPVVNSYAKKAMSTSRTVYNYFRRSSSTVGGVAPDIIDNTVLSEKYAIENCNPKYLDDVLLYVAKRIHGNMKSRWVFADKLAAELNDLLPRFESCKKVTEAPFYDDLKKLSISDSQMIPKRVCLTNFDGSLTEEMIENVRNKAFDECEVVVLDKSTCEKMNDPIINKALEAGNVEFAEKYAALCDIYENGGVYLDRRIVLEKPLNYLRLNSAFFSFIDKNTYSDWIFGGIKGQKVIKNILDTYTNGRYKDSLLPLSRRIKNILTVMHGVPLNGKLFLNDDRLAVYSPDVLVVNMNKNSEKATVVHICTHDFSNEPQCDENMVVKCSTLSLLQGNASTQASFSNTGNLSEKLKHIEAENEQLKARVASIENSDAYRLALKLKDLGQTSKPVKSIVKKIMNAKK